jgi:hypothetical protein
MKKASDFCERLCADTTPRCEEPLGQKLSALAPRAEKCEKTYALRKRKLRPKAVCNRTPCMPKSMMTR